MADLPTGNEPGRPAVRADHPARVGAVAWRWLACLAFWLVLDAPTLGSGSLGSSLTSLAPGLVAGAVAAAAGTAVSLMLVPPGGWRVRPVAAARFAVRSGLAAVAAGADVAWRAVRPSMPLRPGFVRRWSSLPAGMPRDAFVSITALLPGTLPVAQRPDGLVEYHCLDRDAPVADSIASDETRFAQAIAAPAGHAEKESRRR